MKGFLLFIFIVSRLFIFHAYSQSLPVKDFISVSTGSSKKFDNFLSKKRFVAINKSYQNGSAINTYSFQKKIKRGDTQTVKRIIETYRKDQKFSFAFHTSSQVEYMDVKKQLKKEDFICRNENDSCSTSFLFQHKNISVLVTTNIKDDDTLYSFLFHEEELPLPANIHYAEDLLRFTSHEYLVSVFGEKNVKSDLYYFSEKEINACSVLFPHTKRQAVFIWKDEINLCQISYVLLGGNMTTGGSIDYKEVIDENKWMSKEGVYSGMSLSNLARLNGSDFKFYGKNSEFPLMVVPENTGSVNFKKNMVVLGCLSLNGSPLLNKSMISADEALSDNPGLYVFMIMLLPPGTDAFKAN
jgi:hypothetical protein